QALLDGANLRLVKMLVGACARSEPRIVGEVEQPARSRSRLGDLLREDDLVADERRHWRRARDRQESRLLPHVESAAHVGELHHAETFEKVLAGQIFAEWHEMNLCVTAGDATLAVDDEHAVVGAVADEAPLGVTFLDEPPRSD